jgi:hypothetical protein
VLSLSTKIVFHLSVRLRSTPNRLTRNPTASAAGARAPPTGGHSARARHGARTLTLLTYSCGEGEGRRAPRLSPPQQLRTMSRSLHCWEATTPTPTRLTQHTLRLTQAHAHSTPLRRTHAHSTRVTASAGRTHTTALTRTHPRTRPRPRPRRHARGVGASPQGHTLTTLGSQRTEPHSSGEGLTSLLTLLHTRAHTARSQAIAHTHAPQGRRTHTHTTRGCRGSHALSRRRDPSQRQLAPTHTLTYTHPHTTGHTHTHGVGVIRPLLVGAASRPCRPRRLLLEPRQGSRTGAALHYYFTFCW